MRISLVTIIVVKRIASVKFETRVCNKIGGAQIASFWCNVITCAIPSYMIKCYFTRRDCVKYLCCWRLRRAS